METHVETLFSMPRSETVTLGFDFRLDSVVVTILGLDTAERQTRLSLDLGIELSA